MTYFRSVDISPVKAYNQLVLNPRFYGETAF